MLTRIGLPVLAAIVAGVVLWWLVVTPRLQMADMRINELQADLSQREAVIEAQTEQLNKLLLLGVKYDDLERAITSQLRNQSANIEKLRQSNENIRNYLAERVPNGISRLYDRTGTNNPTEYMPTD